MKLFLGWSGEKSRLMAVALRDWLPKVLPAVVPWLSDQDLRKGATWVPALLPEVSTADAGVISVTRDNHADPWVNFETGMLSAGNARKCVCTLLLDLAVTDLAGPLGVLNATKLFGKDVDQKAEFLKLLGSLNDQLKDLKETSIPPTNLAETLEVWWPKIAPAIDAATQPPGLGPVSPLRSDRDLLEEILELARKTSPVKRKVTFSELLRDPAMREKFFTHVAPEAPSSGDGDAPDDRA